MSFHTSRIGLFLAGALALAGAPGCQEEDPPPLPEPSRETGVTAQGLACGNSLVPVMTGATAPSGTVTRSGVLGASYEAWQAFDAVDSAASMWLSQVGQAPAWLAYEWPDAARTVTHYAITFVNGGLTSRAPKSWTLEGWNGTAWVVVDTRNNEVNWGGTERRRYPVPSPGAYRKYRVSFTDDNDARAGIETISIGRLELLSCACVIKNEVPDMTGTTVPSGTVTQSSVFDGDTLGWKAFDAVDTGASLWISFPSQAPVWLGYEWASGTRTITRYALRLANGDLTSRAPRNWTLEGWNGTAWVVVDRRSNEGNWGWTERREYAVASPGAYSAYRLHVTDDNDARTGIEVISLGRMELLTCVMDVTPPASPVLTGFSPASPSTTTQPVLAGTAEASSTVRLFSGSACAGTAVATVVASAGGAFSKALTVTPNTTATFSATATDASGNVSACSPAISYRHDTIAPAIPVFTGFIPASPGNTPQPVLAGTTEAGATVHYFAGGSCAGSGTALGTAVAAANGAFFRTVSVSANTTATFSVMAVDAAGNTSACSQAVSYRHDNVVPATPVFTGFTPASPGTSLTPQLGGTTEKSAGVTLFRGSGCVAPSVATVTADATTGAFTSTLTVSANQSTTFSARAVDAAGNASTCSAAVTYVNDSSPPGLTVIDGIIPFPTPPFVGAVRAQTEPGARVALFSNATCTVQVPSGTEVVANTSGGVLLPLTQEQVGFLVFARARDAVGNTSSCVSFVADCPVGRGDCDGNPANGCEADLMTDEGNCGACGTTCDGAASASAVCGAGTCGLGCAVGTFDCDGAAANGCESSTACDSAVCQVDAPEELLVTALSVVEDPVRTTGTGAWTFGTLMRQMNGGMDPSGLVRTWLRTWEQNQLVGPSFVPARTSMRPMVLGPWEARSGGASQPLDFSTAPFRLLAIVNRMDLRREGVHSGEGRFVFGVTSAGGTPLPFTVILEYTLPGGGPEEIQRWARDWHELGRLGVSHPTYNAKLQALTDRFTKSFVTQGGFLGSAISQVRTNENALDFEWELREFHFGAQGLVPAPVALTPEFFLNGSPLVRDFVNQNQAAILAGTHEVPPLFQGQPFLAGSSLTPFDFFWQAPGTDPEARHQFSLNTCNGCHAGETRTGFLHVGPRPPGQEAFLSPFLFSPSPMPDRITSAPRVFNDLGRREVDLENLVCGVSQNPSVRTGAVGEALLAPRGFPPRSNLPAGRVH
ncbi:Ig-like domain-containing protein [Pyxidicoccus xibeiensis]|uniref:Ig-like domain-containing protein n=1 Tax=Pyxidicoccus xibeiensis TaxID=2906759 RepID=UPI0020A71C3C|nr:Ig-like domain-containing protein [Pyxidicoccus xibeiensis]MCP3140949.1 Ig-like domain-containing protein [Pyxidicoccus xibeiensis]